MISKRLLSATLAILLIFFAVQLIWQDSSDIESQSTETDIPNRISSFLTQAIYSKYDNDGNKIRIIRSPDLSYYGDENRASIQSPQIEIYRPDGELWLLSGQVAEADFNTEQMTITGDVVLRQNPDSDASWQLDTRSLFIDMQKRFIHSEDEVTIQDGTSVIQANGLDGWLDSQTIELLDNVKVKLARFE